MLTEEADRQESAHQLPLDQVLWNKTTALNQFSAAVQARQVSQLLENQLQSKLYKRVTPIC